LYYDNQVWKVRDGISNYCRMLRIILLISTFQGLIRLYHVVCLNYFIFHSNGGYSFYNFLIYCFFTILLFLQFKIVKTKIGKYIKKIFTEFILEFILRRPAHCLDFRSKYSIWLYRGQFQNLPPPPPHTNPPFSWTME